VTCLHGELKLSSPYFVSLTLSLFSQRRSPAEIKDRRRFVRLIRKQQGSHIHLRMAATSADEVAFDDCNVINCLLIPDCGDEPSVSSVDIIKALELLVSPPGGRLSIEEKNRVRRNIDTLRPITLKKGGESLSWIMQLCSPRPITIAREVKIFKWSSLEAALVKIMKKYVSLKPRIVCRRGAYTASSLIRRMALLSNSVFRLLLTAPRTFLVRRLLAIASSRSRARLSFQQSPARQPILERCQWLRRSWSLHQLLAVPEYFSDCLPRQPNASTHDGVRILLSRM
jgi:hypothetical protein